MFEGFDERARLAVVLAQEEAHRHGHAEIGADHLLLGIARVEPALVAVAVERIRGAVVARRGLEMSPRPSQIPLTPDAIGALERAGRAAAEHRETVGPSDLLRALLEDDGEAKAVLAAGPDAPPRQLPDGALRTAPPDRPDAATADLEERRRDGHPVTVALGHIGLIGDLGHPTVDAKLLRLMLAADGRSARLLGAHGIDETAIRAALGYPPDPG